MMKSFLLLLFLIPTAWWAQGQTVTGTVKGADGPDGLPGVSVVVKGTNTGTITDFDGKYSIQATANDVLVFSFVGMKTAEMTVGNQTNIDITLEIDTEILADVVVVGYGVQKKKVSTGAIASVKSEDITQTPIQNAGQSLQGKSAGVTITTTSGAPGSGINVLVRGVGSNGDTKPLYIVDGVQVGDLNFLTAEDIASIDVLKDVASAAIYGSRGANGVILVTTKGGKKGTYRAEYSGYYGIQNAWKITPVLNTREYMMLHNEARLNDNLSLVYTDEDFAKATVSTNWQKEIFRPAPVTNHSLQFSGGNERSTFMASLGYYNAEGFIGDNKSNFERITVRLNSTHELSKYITFGNNLSLVHTNSKGIAENDEFGSALQEAMIYDPQVPVHVTDPDLIEQYDNMPIGPTKDPNNGLYYGISSKPFQEIANPLAKMENIHSDNGAYNVIGNLFLEAKPLEKLKLRSDFGVDMGYSYRRGYNPAFYYSTTRQNAVVSVTQQMERWNNWQWENTATYDVAMGNHALSLLAGVSARYEVGGGLGGSRQNPSILGLDYAWLNNGADDDTQKSFGYPWEHALASYFGRVSYNYKERYLLTLVGRYDGSSRFGTDNKFAFFPSVQAGWVLTEEEFLKDIPLLSFAKLRLAYGQSGNESIGDFRYIETVGQTPSYPIGSGKTPTAGSAISSMSNPVLQWENSQEFDLGADIRLLNDQIQLNFDYYNRVRENLLSTRPIPGYVGLGAPSANIGTVQNRGVELALSYFNKENAFKYEVSVNGAYNQNEVTQVNNPDKYINYAGAFQHVGNLRMEEGYALPFFYGFKTNGLFQNAAEVAAYVNAEGEAIQPNARPGDIRFVDTNNDGKIDADDRTNIGSPTPDFTFGFNFRAEYKGFDFSLFVQGQTGNELVNVMHRLELNASQNYHARYLERWTGEGTTNEFPRFTHADPNKNYSYINDMVHIEDASYVRLKNIQLGYTLPKNLSSIAGVDKLRVYVSGQNMLTFTNYSGMDPEMGHGGIYNGFDRGSYPQARTVLFGVNLNF